MRLKSIALIIKWEVQIKQGIPGIPNLGVPGKP
jgi:hypothetical protein